MPAGIGGMPFSVNRASERQSADQLALALHDVEVEAGLVVGVGRERLLGAARDGRVAGISFSTTPPIVSSPSDSGTTSSSSTSSWPAPPASRSAWIAAPSATTWSGSMSASGSWPNSLLDEPRTSGMRVAPPTRMTPSSLPALDARVA